MIASKHAGLVYNSYCHLVENARLVVDHIYVVFITLIQQTLATRTLTTVTILY